jgi:hypothetical protein
MPYKPNFCCNCGEKIDRTQWSLFSSRRFCPLCETENKEQDYFVRGVVATGVLLGLFGLSTFFRAPSVGHFEPEIRPAASLSKKPASIPAIDASNIAENKDSGVANLQSVAREPVTRRPTAQTIETREPAEAVFYCQAMTKKGTRCTRRVKSPGFCWQHARSQVPLSVRTAR